MNILYGGAATAGTDPNGMVFQPQPQQQGNVAPLFGDTASWGGPAYPGAQLAGRPPLPPTWFQPPKPDFDTQVRAMVAAAEAANPTGNAVPSRDAIRAMQPLVGPQPNRALTPGQAPVGQMGPVANLPFAAPGALVANRQYATQVQEPQYTQQTVHGGGGMGGQAPVGFLPAPPIMQNMQMGAPQEAMQAGTQFSYVQYALVPILMNDQPEPSPFQQSQQVQHVQAGGFVRYAHQVQPAAQVQQVYPPSKSSRSSKASSCRAPASPSPTWTDRSPWPPWFLASPATPSTNPPFPLRFSHRTSLLFPHFWSSQL
jgi:hypothetical protein